MKPGPWIPITSQPVRNGLYDVRDSVTKSTARWIWYGVPGGGGEWRVPEGLYVTTYPDTLEWRGLTDEIWTTRDGQEVPVFQLDGEHAKNILRMLMRKARERDLEMIGQGIKRGSWLSRDAWERGE